MTRMFLQTVLVFALSAMLIGCEPPARKKRNNVPGSNRFAAARELVVTGKYEEGIKELKHYQGQHPEGEHASRAGLFLGKAYLATDDLPAAQAAFEQTIQSFPESLEAHKSRYKLAMILFWENKTDEALKAFEAISSKPDGPLAAEAGMVAKHLRSQLPAKEKEDVPPKEEEAS